MHAIGQLNECLTVVAVAAVLLLLVCMQHLSKLKNLSTTEVGCGKHPLSSIHVVRCHGLSFMS